MRFPRSSGILMPIFSLPGATTIGDLGPAAYQFVDFLKLSGQSIWQLLPLGPPARGNSPYSSYSAFAGNPLLISPAGLIESGLLSQDDVKSSESALPNSKVNYDLAEKTRRPLLRKAFANFCRSAETMLHDELHQFRQANEHWLPDFVLYESLSRKFDNPDWSAWPEELVRSDARTIAAAREDLSESIRQSEFEQFLFDRQWKAMKQYANDNGIRIYGDMPIFVAFESADVWRNQELFQLDKDGRPEFVAGVPPDYFSANGQMWGNPLYRWDELARTNFEWWMARLGQAFQAFDILRLDHFRGFESYWEIPGNAENAIDGQWKQGPGTALFEEARRRFGTVAIVAEDLGLITDAVHHLRDAMQFPGMRVLQFGFDNAEDSYHRPEDYPEHSVAYTGTHDNETVMGWYERRLEEGVDQSLLSLRLSGNPDLIHIDLIRSVMDSAADTVIIPFQDLCGLGNHARTNTPGVSAGNWNYRCEGSELYEEILPVLRGLTEASGRVRS